MCARKAHAAPRAPSAPLFAQDATLRFGFCCQFANLRLGEKLNLFTMADDNRVKHRKSTNIRGSGKVDKGAFADLERAGGVATTKGPWTKDAFVNKVCTAALCGGAVGSARLTEARAVRRQSASSRRRSP